MSFEIFLAVILLFAVATIFSILNPFGIFFVIFSIIRAKTLDERLRSVSFIVQIIMCLITFMLGTLISILLFFESSGRYLRGFDFNDFMNTLPIIAVFFGVLFVVIMEIGVIVWITHYLKKKDSVKPVLRTRIVQKR